MPLAVAATTVPVIEDAFRATLEGLTPRVQRGQGDHRWKYWAEVRAPAMGTRWFRFEWDYDGLTDGGFMFNRGASVDVTCSIVVDYNLPDHELDAVVIDDHWQVRDVLDALRLTTNGLRRVQSLTWGVADLGDEEATQIHIVHQYTVRYVLAKAV